MCQNILHVISHVWLKSSQPHYDVAKEKVFNNMYGHIFRLKKHPNPTVRKQLKGKGALKPKNKKMLARYTSPPPQYT